MALTLMSKKYVVNQPNLFRIDVFFSVYLTALILIKRSYTIIVIRLCRVTVFICLSEYFRIYPRGGGVS
jgi:hypothetical protein